MCDCIKFKIGKTDTFLRYLEYNMSVDNTFSYHKVDSNRHTFSKGKSKVKFVYKQHSLPVSTYP